MNIVDPDDNSVVMAALDMDQGGYEDVIILMDNQQATGANPDASQPTA